MLLLGGGALAFFIFVGLSIWLVIQIRMSPERSGDAIAQRPVGAGPTVTVPTSVPPGSEAVGPLPTDRMLVSVTDPDEPQRPGAGQALDIEVMGTNGGHRRRLSKDPALDAAVNTSDEEIWARISPDRRRFVFYRSPRGKSSEATRYFSQELWIANVDGTGVRKVLSNEQKLAIAREHGWPADLAIQGHADWSPDGRRVVMMLGYFAPLGPIPLLGKGETQLFTFDVDRGDLHQVTDRHDGAGLGTAIDPSFTPDGSTIVFVGCPDRQPSCKELQIRSVPADADRTRTSDLVFDGHGHSFNDVYVSPDGRSISWMEVGLLTIKVYVAPFDLGQEVASDAPVLVDAHGGYANWTTDSRHLIYNVFWITDRFAIFTNSFDGRRSHRITPKRSAEQFMLPSP